MKRHGRPLRILAVDGYPDAAESYRLLFELDGHEVRTSENGFRALEIAALWYPDVIFLDVALPRMDGYALAERLRQLPGLESLPVIVVTGHTAHELRHRSQAAGFHAHLLKPANPQDIADIIARLHPSQKGNVQ